MKREKIAATPRPVRLPLDRGEAKRLYEGGLTVKAVALQMGYAYSTVQRALREQGLGPHPPVSKTGKWAPELYSRWKGLRARCNQPGSKAYPRYGARGIRICAQWDDFQVFREWALKAGFRPGLDLALIRDDRDFSPRNCSWQTRSETVLRTLRERSPKIRAFGQTKTLVEWSADRRCRVSPLLVRRRLKAGHEPEVAMSSSSGALRGGLRQRRSKPLLEVRKRGKRVRREIDWERAERKWRADPSSFAAFARNLGVSRSMAEKHLGHLKYLTQEARLLPADQEAKLRQVWRKLLHKVSDPSVPLYKFIGGKGLGVCRVWRRFERFLEWAASSGYRPGLWLARLDRRKGYSPSNCGWMTPAEALRLPKYGVKPPTLRWPVEAFGEVKALSAWASDRRCQVSRSTLLRRVQAGWEPETALTTPPKNPGPPAQVKVSAFGERKTLIEWSQDRRCRTSINALRLRLLRGVAAEAAISSAAFRVEGPAETRRR